MGTGRSGSTLLDVFLGNNDNTISLGEINRFPDHEGVPPGRDKTSPVYSFWNSVREDLEENSNIDYKLQNQLARKNEYHTAAFRLNVGKSHQDYCHFTRLLYKAISKHTAEKILIESSKYPLRALHISRILKDTSVNIVFIYLKRNPVNVVTSFQKKNLEQPFKGFWASNVYYFVVNLLCMRTRHIVRKQGYKVLNLKYEDFIANPLDILNKVNSTTELDFTSLKDRVAKNERLKTGFLFMAIDYDSQIPLR